MENTEHFRQKLVALKDEISSRLHAIDKDMRHEGMSKDWEEQATERENDEVLDSLGNASEQELAMINAAIARIDAGEYFNCSVCGKRIPDDRLESLPFTTQCVDCAE
jgi:RNA polymerase-binding transcription factor DksA